MNQRELKRLKDKNKIKAQPKPCLSAPKLEIQTPAYQVYVSEFRVQGFGGPDTGLSGLLWNRDAAGVDWFPQNSTSIWGFLLWLYWGYIGAMEKKMETTII